MELLHTSKLRGVFAVIENSGATTQWRVSFLISAGYYNQKVTPHEGANNARSHYVERYGYVVCPLLHGPRRIVVCNRAILIPIRSRDTANGCTLLHYDTGFTW